MKYKNKIGTIVLVLVVSLVVAGCGFKSANLKPYALKLEIWGLFDSQDAYRDIFENYRKANPQVVEIIYKKLTNDTYKKDILEALASGQGPDIFLVNNDWLPMFGDKILPAPQDILNEQKFRNDFVDVVVSDFLYQNKIYAAPMSVDSLGLFYNKDLFNEAGLTATPGNWKDFVEDVKKLTKFDQYRRIVQSGAAMGTAYNINRSTDVLNLLMLQTGTEMIDETSGISKMDKTIKKGDGIIFPGENALEFYTQFAKNGGDVYSWNPSLHYSIDAFSEGSVAMMLSYAWNIEAIISKAPKLNFAVAPVPQLGGNAKINYADYWAYAVAKNKSANANTNNNLPPVDNETRMREAWELIKFMTAKPDPLTMGKDPSGKQVFAANFDPAISYLMQTEKPAGRKDLIEIQKTDPKLGVIAEANLTAKSWRQKDSETIEGIMAEMIDSVNKGRASVRDAIKIGTAQITQVSTN
ncbi:MAG: hypothetical protein COU40_00505 [Candidatus Moranbacteria bacterium CG10_big_fil_rev_8_21_14_0_10_35_21]|nr:MAG: hypothetical protein COU40_00505 [Candidatus Moranbacteria bacterium CG10_big_fil_rev_8_21_14_0_10_35_21]PJA88836.1 MAG: hypothetical protein CO139_00975 [Candidatus Moranbacteria bacterium CG_4_9_14_3_um_filter_36_9]